MECSLVYKLKFLEVDGEASTVVEASMVVEDEGLSMSLL